MALKEIMFDPKIREETGHCQATASTAYNDDWDSDYTRHFARM